MRFFVFFSCFIVFFNFILVVFFLLVFWIFFFENFSGEVVDFCIWVELVVGWKVGFSVGLGKEFFFVLVLFDWNLR